MPFSKIEAFSRDNKFFACFSTDDKLLIWETSSAVFIDCKYDSSVHSTCTSVHWLLPQRKQTSPKKAKKSRNYLSENNLLAVGTAKGDILLYNVASKNLYLHLVARHSDAVNDMFYYTETNSFFTCSNDKSIAIWDITSGQQISKWKTDSPVSSICVIDENNMLSSSISILWWNIPQKCIIKKFSGHSTEIFRLLPVNAVSLNSCYFLSAAVNDFKINAWSLNSAECETPVASFVISDQLEDIDISNISSKDKPLILSAITKNGFLHLFEHILNGNLNQPIQPTVSIEISSKVSYASIISTQLSPDSESCIIAYGTSKANMTFKHIKIRESLKQSGAQATALNKSRCQEVKEASKMRIGLPINGVKSSSTSENSPKVTYRNEADAVISNCQRKLRLSSKVVSLTEPEILNTSETEDSSKSSHKNRSCIKEIDVKDPKTSGDILLRGLQIQNEEVINAILNNGDMEFISTTVKSLPTDSLKDILSALNHRLQHYQKYSPTLSKWLKEILKVHLNYLVQSQDTTEALSYIRKQMDSMKISETISKLSVLKGFLNLQIQNSSSEESDQENDEPMDL